MTTTHHPKYFPVLAREIARMQKILVEDLPKCYFDGQHGKDALTQFEYDFWPSFSWTDEAMKEQINELLASDEWLAIASQVKLVYGYDFVRILNEGLAFNPENC